MRILLIEDNPTYAASVIPRLREIGGVNLVEHAECLEAAEEVKEIDYFDLIILDLSIPIESGSLHSAPEHGQRLFHSIRNAIPGTPVFILTGSESDHFQKHLVRFGENLDIWGSGKSMPICEFFSKEEVDELLDRVREIVPDVNATDKIQIDTRGRDLELSACHKRILKVYTRKSGGVACEVRPLSGGLSDALVVMASAKDAQRNNLAICAAKLASTQHVAKEYAVYDRHVKRLKMGFYPLSYCLVDKGVGTQSGLFYTLAEDQRETLFELLKRDAAIATNTVDLLFEGFGRWSDSRIMGQTTVAEIRRTLVDDAIYADLLARHDLSFAYGVEEKTLNAARGYVHGDLHCGNVLTDRLGRPVIIDFGDVKHGFCCVDPITLELSLIFHPFGVKTGLSSELRDLLSDWPHIDKYASATPYAAFISRVRGWAHDVGGGDQDVLAAGYGFALRQLKYATVPEEFALTLLRGICDKMTSLGA